MRFLSNSLPECPTLSEMIGCQEANPSMSGLYMSSEAPDIFPSNRSKSLLAVGAVQSAFRSLQKQIYTVYNFFFVVVVAFV